MDENVANFVAITSADPQRATQYLQLADNNLEQAIQLFFDSPNLDVGSTQPAGGVNTAPAEASRGHEDDQGVVHIDSDDDFSEAVEAGGQARNAPQAAYEDDEAMARRMQEEMYGGGGPGGGMQDVRAPIARTTDTLVGPGADYVGGGDINDLVAEQMLARQRRRPAGRPGIFNQDTAASVWDQDAQDGSAYRANLATGGASEASAKSNLLAELFRPPFELMSRMSWDDARAEGKEQEKWLLVNIQDPAVFDCQVLNRDIWKNPEIKMTVKENFIFMQYSKDDPKGNSYNQYYFHTRDSADAYPHIAIVDPRTGEQVKVWSGPPAPKAMDFLMQLHEFLDRYSLRTDARNPIAKRKQESKPVDVDRMTEEEMLEMAMKNSVANGGGPRDADPDDLTRSVDQLDKGKGKADAMDLTEDEPTPSNGATPAAAADTPFSRISASNAHDEPADDKATTTRIQFRHAGGRTVRRFALADPVRRIYEWLKASPFEGKEGAEFELVFMGKNLIDQLDLTIQEAGLRNGSVMVEFVDES